MTVLEVLQKTTRFFASKGIDNPRREAEWILSFELGLPRLQLYLQFERQLSEDELGRIREKVRRRARREPLAYILGTAVFCGLELKVDHHVLIPRPETESLAIVAAQWAKDAGVRRILDFGTGSGCLAIYLAKQLPGVKVTALDISQPALQVAKENAERHGVADRIEFVQSSGFCGLERGCQFDLIVSNPPYIPEPEYQSLQPEVRDYEPKQALIGGPDGLEVIRLLASNGKGHLVAGGRIYMEFGDGQADKVRKIFEDNGWHVIKIETDLSGKERILVAEHVLTRHASHASTSP